MVTEISPTKPELKSLLQSSHPLIMGILNVTPDSFSDGSQFINPEQALQRAGQMLLEGADIIDIGGESTRPGAEEVTVDEELNRVIPLVYGVKKLGGRVSVDTSKPEVMAEAIKAGADLINDVRALELPGALAIVAKSQTLVCLMHMQGQPQTMQVSPQYQDVVRQVSDFLTQKAHIAIQAGISHDNIIIDPGFGFGKNLGHNLQLLNQLDSFKQSGFPILAGLSRKSMLGQITGRPVDQRLAGSLAVALVAMQKGVNILRVHDVKETADLRKVFLALAANNTHQE